MNEWACNYEHFTAVLLDVRKCTIIAIYEPTNGTTNSIVHTGKFRQLNDAIQITRIDSVGDDDAGDVHEIPPSFV